MSEERILVVRLGSLGDLVHTLPAVNALRNKFPRSEIDWVVENKWRALLAGNPDVNDIIRFDRSTWTGISSCVRQLRRRKYDCAIDFQGLYKSALLARLSGAKRRIGYAIELLRESGAAWFYTERVQSTALHIVDQNLELAHHLGAERWEVRFPLAVPDEAERFVRMQLGGKGGQKYFVVSPGGGWMSKCWPAEQYGHLLRRLLSVFPCAGWRGVVNYGPGERNLAEAVRLVAGDADPLLFSGDLPQLMALVRGASLFVGGDSGPLHLAVALGAPVVGLYGPTDPARNGPYSRAEIVVRNARSEETTYKRDSSPALSMRSITVEQVVNAIGKRLGVAA
ncbi:MAG: glycosyltransferase family 9 protein [Acidobacteria bacterium]|nr:glycosyltransferase family 9 protein [Acidobacteriota bacterium]MCL5289324.1 glycosyltransferase family 9 protein [Acidobacteriota bacterium]